MNKIFHYIKRNTSIPLFLFILFVDNLYTISISCIINKIDPSIIDVSFPDDIPLVFSFFITVIFGPLLETFIFQFLIIEVLYKFRISNIVIIWISTLSFSLVHNYNIIYILIIIFPAFLYASYYMYLKLEKKETPFMTIYLLHALANLLAFILDDVLELA